MQPQDYPTHWRTALRTLGEDLLESYMMRMLDESLSGSSAPLWLGIANGYRSLPSYMVRPGLESPPSSIFWSSSSKATQLRSMRELLDPSQISSRPALLPRVRSWPSTKMETYLGSSPTGSSTASSLMRPFSSMRRAFDDFPSELMRSCSSGLTSLLRSQTPSPVSSVDLSTSPLPGTNWISVSIKLS